MHHRWPSCSFRADQYVNGKQVVWNAVRNCGFVATLLHSPQKIRKRAISKVCVCVCVCECVCARPQQNAVWVSVLGGAVCSWRWVSWEILSFTVHVDGTTEVHTYSKSYTFVALNIDSTLEATHRSKTLSHFSVHVDITPKINTGPKMWICCCTCRRYAQTYSESLRCVAVFAWNNKNNRSDTAQFHEWHTTLLNVSTPEGLSSDSSYKTFNPYPANVENMVSS